jgi:ABC-2 type transport system permease protein
MSSTSTQVVELARRSILRTLRQPASIVPALLFPLIFLALNSGGLASATRIPGFPTDSYLAFFLAVPFIQAALFATMGAGTDVAKDVQTGFVSRLALTPTHGNALLFGQLAGVLAVSLFSSLMFLIVGLIAGVTFESGLAGMGLIMVLATLIGIALSSIGVMLGMRSGSGEAVQGMFPLFFVFLFLSSLSMPRSLIEQDWFRTIATYNPVSYLLEAIRSLIITGWDGRALALGFTVAIALVIVSIFGASRAVRRRWIRT